ncbi:MAG: ribosomal protein S18-alanine N-acetyltransferase [Vicinamibacterales bacterium]
MLITRMSAADDGDLDAVVALEAASFTNPWSREMLARELEQPSSARVYVLRLPDTAVAAFCSCWVIGDELHVNTIAVDPARRRQGLGLALMDAVLTEVAREGVTRATLEVRRSNVAAQQLYARLGFEVAGQRRKYYTQPEEDAFILWRRNPDPHTRDEPAGRP